MKSLLDKVLTKFTLAQSGRVHSELYPSLMCKQVAREPRSIHLLNQAAEFHESCQIMPK